jgi:DNA-binding beta-propeller fold protein YncE
MRNRLPVVLASLLAGLACSGGSSAPDTNQTAYTISVVSGDGQTGVVGEAAPSAVVVLVQDQAGRSVPGAVVTFAVTAGGGSVEPAQVATASNGTATATKWTLGQTAGANVLEVRVASALRTVAATGKPGPVSTMRFTSSDTILLDQGQSIAMPPLTITDAYGNATSSPVSFAISGSSAQLAGSSITGTGPGLSRLTATSGDFVATRIIGVIGQASGIASQLVPLDFRPYGVAASGTTALLTQLDNGLVTVFDVGETATLRASIRVGSTPTGVSVTPDGARAYVSNQGDGNIGEVDVLTESEGQLFPLPATTFRTLTSRDGTRAYGSSSAGHVVGIEVATGRVLFTDTLSGPINGLATDATDARLYATSMNGGVTVLDAQAGSILRTIPLAGTLQDVLVSPDGNSLFVADESSGLVVLSIASGEVTSRLSLPGAFGLALSPGGKRLWISRSTMNLVDIVDVATGEILNALTGFATPRRIAFDRFGVALVAEEGAGLRVLH